METLTIASLEEIDQAAASFLERIGDARVIAFNGTLGAGKTTFIKSLCRQLSSNDNIASPTFAIVNEYSRSVDKDTSEPIFHMDLYRLNDVEEALNAGIHEYITGDYYCFIEWPDLIKSILPEDTLFTLIEADTDKNQRKLTIFN